MRGDAMRLAPKKPRFALLAKCRCRHGPMIGKRNCGLCGAPFRRAVSTPGSVWLAAHEVRADW